MNRSLGKNPKFREIEDRVRKQEKAKNTRSVVWEKEEKKLFIDEFVRIRLREPFLTPNTIMDLAQKVLSEDRRMRVELLNALPWLESDIKASLRSVSGRLEHLISQNATLEKAQRQYYNTTKQTERKIELLHSRAERAENIANELQEDIDLLKTDPQYLLKFIDRPTLLTTAMTMFLNDNRNILEKVEKIEEQVSAKQTKSPVLTPPYAPNKPEPRVKKKYIAVACLLPGQQGEINNHVGDRAKVKHIDGRVPKKNIPNCDRLFIFARKSSHSLQETAFSALGRDRVQIFHGGISNLKNEIDKFLGETNG